MPWVGKPARGQNLYCKEQQKVTDLYRQNYDAIKWDTVIDKTCPLCGGTGQAFAAMGICPQCSGTGERKEP